jgi:hypothetical protein
MMTAGRLIRADNFGMNTILKALGDPAIRGWYLLFCFAVMVLPMIALTFWYHTRIRRTAGGRALMEVQDRAGPGLGRGFLSALTGLNQAGRLAKDIAGGRYGGEVRRMQNRTYWFAAAWLVANVIVFGILFWADEVNRTGN